MMTGFLIFAGILVIVVIVFRHWRKREIEAFLATDMSVFEDFRAIGDQAGPETLQTGSRGPQADTVELPEARAEKKPPVPAFSARQALFDDVHRCCLQALEEVVGERYRLYVHVPLVDLVKAEKIENREMLKGMTVSFVVCDRSGMSPVCGIQLKDAGHSRHSFIEDVFRQIEKPLISLPVRSDYPVIELAEMLGTVLSASPLVRHCPRCGKTMMMRKAVKGKNAGKTFWVCTEFPSCKGIMRIGG